MQTRINLDQAWFSTFCSEGARLGLKKITDIDDTTVAEIIQPCCPYLGLHCFLCLALDALKHING